MASKNFYEHEETSKQRRGILPASEHLYVAQKNTKKKEHALRKV